VTGVWVLALIAGCCRVAIALQSRRKRSLQHVTALKHHVYPEVTFGTGTLSVPTQNGDWHLMKAAASSRPEYLCVCIVQPEPVRGCSVSNIINTEMLFWSFSEADAEG